MATTRTASIVVIIMLQLFLLVAAAYPRAPPHPAADRRHTSADVVVGGRKDMEKPILWRRKMAEPGPHKSPPGPHTFRHQRRLSAGALSEHEDRRPPSPAATKDSGMGGAGDDDVMTKMKEEVIICGSGGKQNNLHDEYGVVPSRCRRWRKLIAAGASDSPPSPGYHRH